MSNAAKRPFPTELLKTSIVIDLTSDNEDARPQKRQRSESYATPKIQAHNSAVINDTSRITPTSKQGNATITSAHYLSNKYGIRDSNGKLVATSLPPKPSTTRNVPSHSTNSNHNDQSRAVLASDGTCTSNTSTPQYGNNVTNGMKSLTLRPSPGPQYLSKSLRVPQVIDFETDSDRASKKSKKNDDSRRSVSSSEIHQLEAMSSAKFSERHEQPIKSDQTATPPSRKPFTQGNTKSGSESHSIQSRSLQYLPKPTKGLYPPSKPEIRIVLPPNPKEKASRQKEIIQKIKDDPSYLEQNPEEVFRITGVKSFDNKDLNEETYETARQKKHQPPVDRSRVLLDFGEPPKALTKTDKISLIHPRKQTRSILNERFQHQGQVPLTFENRINDRRINGKFQFVSNYVFSRKVQGKVHTPHHHRSCSCEHGICGQDCNCLITQLTTKIDDTEHTVDIRTYQRHSEQKDLIVLSDALIDDSTHTARIFECGDFCRCSQYCINRVVQKGRTIPLQIFETGKYGFGVRSSVPLLRGQFIDIYLGEVITEQEVSKREAAAEEDTPSYIMSLDAFTNDEKNIFYVDGENFGSVTRFVNHSCEPSCKTIPVVLPKGTKQLYYVAFFAIKDIPAGTELTIDYDPDVDVDEEIDDGVVQCQCGSAKCRKRLWAPGKEQRRRKKRYLPSKDDD